MAEIEWPWQYSFPPFFTLQPHAETKAKQLSAWKSLVLDYYKATKESIVDIREIHSSPLFNNTTIKSFRTKALSSVGRLRRLRNDGVTPIPDAATIQKLSDFRNNASGRRAQNPTKDAKYLGKSGNASALDKSKQRWLVYWHTLQEWGDIIYNWAQEKGFGGSVCTLFELVQGEDTTEEEFHGLDNEVLLRSLRILEADGKAELIMFDDNQGVKFF